MNTLNGGVFGRNPKFNNVTVDGNLTVNGDIALGDDITITDTLTVNGATALSGGLSSRPNASAAQSVVSIGSGAASSVNDASDGVIAIGQNAADLITASKGIVAVGQNALTTMRSGAGSFSNTTPGTGGLSGGSGTVTGVVLEKDSGTGIMTVYPTVTLTIVSGAVTAITITNAGEGATALSGIVMKANAAGIAAGAPADWRCTLITTLGYSVAIGYNALTLYAGHSEGAASTAVGYESLRFATTATSCTGLGEGACRAVTTGSNNTAVGLRAMYQCTTGVSNTALGAFALRVNSTSSSNTAVGTSSLRDVTTGNNTAIGASAGFVAISGQSNNQGTDSVFVGQDTRPSGQSDANCIVIGKSARGDGSNTTVINNSSTTSTRIAGTATSLFAIDGDTMRIVGTRTPASNAAGTAGDFCFGTDSGTTYLYYCIANGNWGRVGLTTGY